MTDAQSRPGAGRGTGRRVPPAAGRTAAVAAGAAGTPGRAGGSLAEDDELWGFALDPGCGPPPEWLTDPCGPGHEAADGARAAVTPGVLRAGTLSRDGGNGPGFASGGAADRLPPGVALAGFTSDVCSGGLARITDDELIGVMMAWRRLTAWTAAGELAAVAELNRRREAQVEAGADPHLAEHVDDELAVSLRLTGRGADQLLEFACGLARLPRTRAALAAGLIDRSRALVVVDEVSCLGDIEAGAVDLVVTKDAPGQTTGQLRASTRRAVLAADPGAAAQRREKARKDARVEVWNERAGTASLAGRDLPPADVLAADQRINALARRLKTGGAEGSMDQLRARACTALLLGQPAGGPPVSDLPPSDEPQPGHPQPAAPDLPGPRTPDPRTPDPSTCVPRTTGPRTTEPHPPTGSVNLTMPLATWLGASPAPGDVAGFGPVPAGDSRALASLLARRPGARWCLTLTGRDGRPVAHGCATTGPASPTRRPRGTGPSPAPGWALTVTIRPFAAGHCGHERRSGAYRPPPNLGHLVKRRNRACCFPGCRRPAARCDLDHTLAYGKGGLTCECNLAPLCRRHHRAKQAHGWRLEQPQPGVLVWTLPGGRSYTVRPTIYPDK